MSVTESAKSDGLAGPDINHLEIISPWPARAENVALTVPGTTSPLRNFCFSTCAIAFLLWGPTLASTALAAGLTWTDLTPFQLMLAAPLLYVAWLLVMLGYFYLETSLIGLFVKKPRYWVTTHGGPIPLRSGLIYMMWLRMRMLGVLPLIRLLQLLYPFDRLVLRAYSTQVHIGVGACVAGELTDPDLTYVHDGALIGHGCVLGAHGGVRLPNGELAFHTAPITVGAFANVAAESLVQMGVTIGEGAMIEPGSCVTPFTNIPAWEVWGGCPAVFKRKRSRQPLNNLRRRNPLYDSPKP